jgi:hypothetical protein
MRFAPLTAVSLLFVPDTLSIALVSNSGINRLPTPRPNKQRHDSEALPPSTRLVISKSLHRLEKIYDLPPYEILVALTAFALLFDDVLFEELAPRPGRPHSDTIRAAKRLILKSRRRSISFLMRHGFITRPGVLAPEYGGPPLKASRARRKL